ncbi:MAG: CBS domain-containing protein [Candidatus Aenigmatarchaeota archaeon]
MSKDIKSVSPDLSAKEALNILFELKISGLPVLDKDGKLLGMFTEKEVLKAILPTYVDHKGVMIYIEDVRALKNRIMMLEKLTVKEVMRKEVVVVNEDISINEVARIMLTEKVRRIPVVDKEKRVVGIVARSDILNTFIKSL